MALKLGRIVGYDADRMTFEFTMMHDARIVGCETSSTALDDLAGEKGVRPGERDAQFRRLHDAIGRLACRVFEEGGRTPGRTIRIFSETGNRRWGSGDRGTESQVIGAGSQDRTAVVS